MTLRKAGVAALVGSLLTMTGCSGLMGPPEVTVTAKDFRYQPEQITVQAGQTVRLKLVNSDTVDHDFTSSAPVTVVKQSSGHSHHAPGAENASIHLHTTARRSDSIDITPMEKGTYEVFCTVEGHKDQGMVATLVVQ